MEGNITFERVKQFYGVLIPIRIYLDGKDVGTVGAGEKIEAKTAIGKHRIAFDLWSGNGQYDVEVTEEHPNIKVEFKIGMGIITSKPKIVKISNL